MRSKVWSSLPFYDPKGMLIEFRRLSLTPGFSELPYKLAALRTNELKPSLQARQCALFCHGMAQRLGIEIRFTPVEDRDLDFVARFERDDTSHFVPMQFKELVPEQVYSQADLQTEIDKLAKYVDSKELIVAFHINKTTTIKIPELDFSRVAVAELWFFGALSEDQSSWVLIGNVLSPDWSHTLYFYPDV